LTQFSRRARWLNSLFTSSKAPQISDPGTVSDDVSLVQPYDGSGYGISNPRTWVTQSLTDPAGITGQLDILTVPEDSVYRLFAASGFKVVGVNPFSFLNVIDLISTPNVACQISPIMQDIVAPDGQFSFDIRNPIVLGPGHTLRIDYIGGSASTVMSYSVFGVLAPIGTVFYC